METDSKTKIWKKAVPCQSPNLLVPEEVADCSLEEKAEWQNDFRSIRFQFELETPVWVDPDAGRPEVAVEVAAFCCARSASIPYRWSMERPFQLTPFLPSPDSG